MKNFINRILLIFLLFNVLTKHSISQQSKLDSLFSKNDSTAVLDSLFKDFHDYLDSIATAKSFFTVSAGIGTGYFNFQEKSSVFLTTNKKPMISPSVGYYHKSGLGISATGFLLLDGSYTGFYQMAVSPSFDYLKNRKFSTGIAYTKYFEKDSLPFYTTPIKDELFAYFSYKGWWIRPTLSLNYGWGSKTDYQRKQTLIWRQRLKRYERGFVFVRNQENVQDLSTGISFKHDFDFFDVLVKEDGFTLTPVVMMTMGTQKFGFNSSYESSFTIVKPNLLPSNQNISDQTSFRPQSVSAIIRADYTLGKFFLMPQILIDYYIPQADTHFNTVYSVITGFNF